MANVGRGDIAILMAAYERPEFFGAQIESILDQSFQNWKLWVSDDSRNALMREVFYGYANRLVGRSNFRSGPHSGFVRNFLSLTCDESISASYYAFADHDDVWLPSKLDRAKAWLDTQPVDRPALYCSRVQLIDDADRLLGRSPLFVRRPSFPNALVQSIAGGNTMVFNEAARCLLVEAGADVDVVVHDWWVYLAVSACGGVVHYDAQPTVSYRQHATNQIGGGRRAGRLLDRIHGLGGSRLQQWIDRNLRGLDRLSRRLSPTASAALEHFENYRSSRSLERLPAFRATGAYRQGAWDNLALYFAAAMGRV